MRGALGSSSDSGGMAQSQSEQILELDRVLAAVQSQGRELARRRGQVEQIVAERDELRHMLTQGAARTAELERRLLELEAEMTAAASAREDTMRSSLLSSTQVAHGRSA